jgi:acyl carrier protein
MTMTTETGISQTSELLMELLEEVTGGTVRPDRRDASEDSIRRLGVNSVIMLEFLVAIEDKFGIEWDDDVDDSVLRSFDRIATHIERERGG